MIRLQNLYFIKNGIYNGTENAENERDREKIILNNLKNHYLNLIKNNFSLQLINDILKIIKEKEEFINKRRIL